jgi:hypothetical protein
LGTAVCCRVADWSLGDLGSTSQRWCCSVVKSHSLGIRQSSSPYTLQVYDLGLFNKTSEPQFPHL